MRDTHDVLHTSPRAMFARSITPAAVPALRPFAAWLVDSAFAGAIVSPAYDSLTPGERHAFAEAHPRSYLNAMRALEEFPADRRPTLDALLAATESGEKRAMKTYAKTPFQEMIAYWLRELGVVESFRLEKIRHSNLWRAYVRTSAGGTETTLPDVGFGVSQVLPILVLLYYVPEGSVVLLEQPEIHLHPSAQTVLADVFFHAIRTRNIQIVVESHSEHLLRRIQRRHTDGPDPVEDVKLYFASASEGKAQMDPLELEDTGEIGNWPVNFFPKRGTLGGSGANGPAEDQTPS